MILNEYGKIADEQWHWLADQYAYIELHEFIVMPNHIHGIIEINSKETASPGNNLSRNREIHLETGRDLSGNNNDYTKENVHNASEQQNVANKTGRDLSLQKIKCLSELMGAYKTTVSKKIHLSGYAEFKWQRSFYDHIIRDEKSYENISNYIINNSNSWDQDKFFRE